MRRWLPPSLLALLPLSLGAGLSAVRPATASPPSPTPQTIHLSLTREPGLSAGVRAALERVPAGVQVGVLVRGVGGGPVLEAQQPDAPMIPASTMKLVTAASVLLDRGGGVGGGWWSTELTVPAAEVGRAEVTHLTLRGQGDPTLSASEGPNSLRALAGQAAARGIRQVGALRLDDTPLKAEAWTSLVLGLPMPALRLREWEDTPPLTAQAARERLGAALIAELRRAGVEVESAQIGTAAAYVPYTPPPRTDDQGRPLPPDPVVPLQRRPEQGVASVRSGSPAAFLAATLRPSDNLRAEALLATLAAVPGGGPGATGTPAGARSRERAFLRRMGVDLSGVHLADGSGLSRDNRLTARALVGVLAVAHDLPFTATLKPKPPAEVYRTRRNLFAEALPQAGTGEARADHEGRGGTLALRLRGSGLDVRAKTGTLPGVSALAGYVTARSGRVLAFAILMNGPQHAPILTLRSVQDEMVRALAEAH